MSHQVSTSLRQTTKEREPSYDRRETSQNADTNSLAVSSAGDPHSPSKQLCTDIKRWRPWEGTDISRIDRPLQEAHVRPKDSPFKASPVLVGDRPLEQTAPQSTQRPKKTKRKFTGSKVGRSQGQESDVVQPATKRRESSNNDVSQAASIASTIRERTITDVLAAQRDASNDCVEAVRRNEPNENLNFDCTECLQGCGDEGGLARHMQYVNIINVSGIE